MTTVRLPNNWSPRPYQLPLWHYLESGGRRAVAVWNRRSGKDDVALHWTACAAIQKPAVYWHMLPKANQARKAIWDAVNPLTGIRRIDEAFPQEIRKATVSHEMKIEFVNGSVWQVVGSDNYDSLVGSPPYGLVFSEWPLSRPAAWDYLRPILRENGGWVIFVYTARGRNHGYSLYRMACEREDWFSELLTVDDTGVLTPEDIEAERAEGMPEERIASEYFCDFNAPIPGTYWGEQIRKAREAGRITRVPWQTEIPVHTAWDIGIGDATAIWFFQLAGPEIHVIDYYENDSQGVEHYAKMLKDKPYVYGDHWAPHDIRARTWGTGKTQAEMARSFGIDFKVQPRLSVEDGIQAVRAIFSRCWIDAEACERGIDGLSSYCKEWDEDKQIYKDTPLHNWASHPADAFRGLAVSIRDKYVPPEPRWDNEMTFHEQFRRHKKSRLVTGERI